MCLPIRATSEPSGQTELQSTPRTQTVQTYQPGRRYYIPTNVHDTQGTEYQYRCKPRTSFHDSSIPSSSPFSRSYNNRDKKREPIILACPVRTNSPQRGTRLFDQKSGKQPRERERYEGTERGCTLRPVSATLMTFFFSLSLPLSPPLRTRSLVSRHFVFFFFFTTPNSNSSLRTTEVNPHPDSETESMMLFTFRFDRYFELIIHRIFTNIYIYTHIYTRVHWNIGNWIFEFLKFRIFFLSLSVNSNSNSRVNRGSNFFFRDSRFSAPLDRAGGKRCGPHSSMSLESSWWLAQNR